MLCRIAWLLHGLASRLPSCCLFQAPGYTLALRTVAIVRSEVSAPVVTVVVVMAFGCKGWPTVAPAAGSCYTSGLWVTSGLAEIIISIRIITIATKVLVKFVALTGLWKHNGTP